MVYQSPDDMPPARMANCATFIMIRDDLRILESALESPETNSEEIAELSRKLVNVLLKMVQSEQICKKELEFTELEIARLKRLQTMTAAMRAKFRIYVEKELRETIGI